MHKEITSSLYKLEEHLENHKNNFAFKVMRYLNRHFPRFFQSPEKLLAEKVQQVQAMQTFVDGQYKSLISNQQRRYAAEGRASGLPQVHNVSGTLSDEEQEQLHLELCEMDAAGNRGNVSCSNEIKEQKIT